MDGLRPPEVGLGALTRWCPPALVDKVVEECGRREERRRLLSARTVVYFELARCLYPREGYQQVFEELLPEDEDRASAVRLPNKSPLPHQAPRPTHSTHAAGLHDRTLPTIAIRQRHRP
ncbi:transposase domain-containing protein [Streptomyces sp. NBC_00996]|nr:transposase domain-containing protein [Streptomyces sp. NBC_00996]